MVLTPHPYSSPFIAGHGGYRLDFDNIIAACEGSLKRLQTDYIDIYYTHWPDRYKYDMCTRFTYIPLSCGSPTVSFMSSSSSRFYLVLPRPSFGDNGYDDKKERPDPIPIEETCRALKFLLDSGKIKAFGISNETSYGVTMYIEACKKLGMPPPCCIQNSYSLLHRSFETELAETCRPMYCNIPLVAWSPLAGGTLTGKYLSESSSASPANEQSRFVQFATTKYQARFWNERSMEAARRYAEIAQKYGMTSAQLALAFVQTRHFTGCTLFGATNISHLVENLSAFDLVLSDECISDINNVFLDIRDPTLEYF
jgi:aryl-alcohol dehydrogenase-like predicted oxidoreductase